MNALPKKAGKIYGQKGALEKGAFAGGGLCTAVPALAGICRKGGEMDFHSGGRAAGGDFGEISRAGVWNFGPAGPCGADFWKGPPGRNRLLHRGGVCAFVAAAHERPDGYVSPGGAGPDGGSVPGAGGGAGSDGATGGLPFGRAYPGPGGHERPSQAQGGAVPRLAAGTEGRGDIRALYRRSAGGPHPQRRRPALYRGP